MYSLRPHTRFDFVRLWKYGFILSGILIALALAGFITSTVITGSPLTLGTEFSGGTSIQINDAGNVTEQELQDAFSNAASELGYSTQISSIQVANNMAGGSGFIVKTTDTVSTNASDIMSHVEDALGLDATTVEIETIGASWGASVIWSSILAFFLSCLGILIVIAIRYREPRMGVVALICLFHDMIIVLGIYAWAGLFFGMEITSDVIAALLAIIGYSLYDTVVVFHRISKNATPQMKCSLTTCANRSLNEVIVRSINTSITSVLPVLLMLILGTDTLLDFAFAMFCGMVVGVYSTLAISAPIYTKWKAKEPAYARLEAKYPYEVVQSPFTKQMMLEARKETAKNLKIEKAELKRVKKEERENEAKIKEEEKALEEKAKAGKLDASAVSKAREGLEDDLADLRAKAEQEEDSIYRKIEHPDVQAELEEYAREHEDDGLASESTADDGEKPSDEDMPADAQTVTTSSISYAPLDDASPEASSDGGSDEGSAKQ